MIWHDRAFQVRAAAIGKARSPTVDSGIQQTGSDDVDADRRWDLIPRSANWKTRYIGAAFASQDGDLMLNLSWSFHPM